MNIADMLSGLKLPTNDSISNKIALKAEIKKIEREADYITNNILDFITREVEHINRGLTYGEVSKISEEDKKELLKKLEEVVKTLPSKVKETVDDIFSSSEENKEEKKETSDGDDGNKEVEVKVTAAHSPSPLNIAPSAFGY